MPKFEIRNVLITCGIMALCFSFPVAMAQVTDQKELADKLQTMLPQVVPATKAPAIAHDPNDPAQDTGGFNDVVRTPAAELLTQQNQQRERQMELAAGGFAWMSWSKAGDTTTAFIHERDPELKNLHGNPKYRDFAVADVDGDGQPDILVYDWSECVAAGCQYTVYFNNKQQKPVSFIVTTLRPVKHGVEADGTYYEF